MTMTPIEHAWLDLPSGHNVYGIPSEGEGAPGHAAPPPPGGQRPAAKAAEVMSAILEPASISSRPSAEHLVERQKFVVGGT